MEAGCAGRGRKCREPSLQKRRCVDPTAAKVPQNEAPREAARAEKQPAAGMRGVGAEPTAPPVFVRERCVGAPWGLRPGSGAVKNCDHPAPSSLEPTLAPLAGRRQMPSGA